MKLSPTAEILISTRSGGQQPSLPQSVSVSISDSSWPRSLWDLITPVRGRHAPLRHKGIVKSLQFLRANSHKSIGVSELVAVSGLSRRGFHKAFLDHIRLSPGLVLRHLRIQRAREMLAKSDAKIENVAVMVGYRSANSFSIAFKRTTGLAPRKFRESEHPAGVRS